MSPRDVSGSARSRQDCAVSGHDAWDLGVDMSPECVLGMLLNGGRCFSDSGSQQSGGADDGTWSMRGSLPGDLHAVGVLFWSKRRVLAATVSLSFRTPYSVPFGLDITEGAR